MACRVHFTQYHQVLKKRQITFLLFSLLENQDPTIEIDVPIPYIKSNARVVGLKKESIINETQYMIHMVFNRRKFYKVEHSKMSIPPKATQRSDHVSDVGQQSGDGHLMNNLIYEQPKALSLTVKRTYTRQCFQRSDY